MVSSGRLIIFLIFSSVAWQVHACSCMDGIPFCEYTSKHEGVIILGLNTGSSSQGTTVAVIEVLQGQESRDTIFILNGMGSMCHGGLYGKTGDTVLIAPTILDSISDFYLYIYPGVQPGDYLLLTCVIDHLKYSRGLLSGYIYRVEGGYNSSQVLNYSEFKSSIKSCNHPYIQIEFSRRYENEFYFRVTNISPGQKDLRIALYDLGGRLIRQEYFSGEKIYYSIDMTGLSKGSYFVYCIGEGGTASSRIIF